MNTIIDKSSMEKAIRRLNGYTKAYDKGKPIISDKDWDNLYFDLKEAEKNLGFTLPNSPTQKINYTIVSELKKINHNKDFPMLSLDKTKNLLDIETKFKNKNWIAMEKCDGLSCRLIYENGNLARAATRGNGLVGEDVTHNAQVINNIPKIIPHGGKLVVDGEIVCLDEDFKPFAIEYSNSRNFAAGSVRLLDSTESAKRNLSFIAWDCIEDTETENYLLSLRLEDLAHYGFTVVDYHCSDKPIADKVVEQLKETARQKGLPIDGIVFKLNNKDEYYTAGQTAHHPSGAIAFKFYDEEYETELLDIEWSMGKTSQLTPVAIYKDIEINDTVCNRASLHNINTLINILGNPYKGQKIWVAKQNQIIPQITRAEVGSGEVYLSIPTACPICGVPTKQRNSDSGTIELYCTNSTCEGLLINRIDHFISKKGLDIKGLSKATLEKLINWGWINNLSDIFTLKEHRNEWILKAGFGVKSVDKMLEAIDKARNTSFAQYISAISIPLIGRTYANELAKEFDDYESFRSAVNKGFHFATLNGFGPEKEGAIRYFNYTEADNMVNMGYITFKTEVLEEINNSLNGKMFCVTGKVHIWKNRDELSAAISAAGGKVVSTVTSKTDYLINNDINSTSSKNKKAKELNIPILTEEELEVML